jgi:hypothetical protein
LPGTTTSAASFSTSTSAWFWTKPRRRVTALPSLRLARTSKMLSFRSRRVRASRIVETSRGSNPLNVVVVPQRSLTRL